ncbi:glycoside hydrolase family 2 TIM barrel-domain containing protein [Opitutales bacterium ASA1]|uniref:sugar-binding domain-containing protein n=1 Tax=Congregicoccus parvus TaxID=3081749 RepID=UPI002B2F1812|nr:glycoside hydrolase family 2 TIM barrel-domain containing protein [Opitutales bacterium ASA1]
MLLRALSCATLLCASFSCFAETIDLAGTWRVELDHARSGERDRWFARDAGVAIELPGSVQSARLGDAVTAETRWTGGIIDKSWFTAPEYAAYREPGNVKLPFWLQPETHFTGSAWYQREIEIPEGWAQRRVVLTLERPHWKTTVWLGEREVGSDDAMSVPHVHDLGIGLAPGRHRLTIRVDNTPDPDLGENSHSISDHTQGNWNGIVGRIQLSTTAAVWIDRVDVEPRFEDRSVVVRGKLGRVADAPWPDVVRIRTKDTNAGDATFRVDADGGFAGEVGFGDGADAWDEFSPVLHRVEVALANGESRAVAFGFREIAAEGRRLLINGRPLFLRGTLDCAAFPRTGHPPTDEAEWRRVFGVVQAHGLNHVRFHSWCPPRAAFEVADAMGLYLQVEVASWPNQSTTLGDGKPVDAWLEAETGRILREYGNHASFVLFAAGNEPGGPNHAKWLSGWLDRHKAVDARRFYTAASGWPEVAESQFHVLPDPRIQSWGEGLRSRINRSAPETRTDYADFIGRRAVPVVSHEIGQWCVYPNFGEMDQYTGYLKPRNFEIFQETLASAGLADKAEAFLHASGKLQALCYKEDIESALRTREMGGFQLLGLQDFPGQGTALVGLVDAFWEEKGYIAPEEFRRFCDSTVPLARLARRVFTTEDHLVADVEVAHFGAESIRKAASTWRLVADDGHVVASGAFDARDIPIGAGNKLGRIDLSLASVPAPARYRLVVALEKTRFENDWDVWVYPTAEKVVAVPPPDVLLASSFNPAVQARLAAGGTVVLSIPTGRVSPDPKLGPIALGFSSIFWNTAWTSRQAPHTLGILCDPEHPAFERFPTDAHSNWQWWYPISNAAPMMLGGLPRELEPIVSVVDDWFTNRKLGLVIEARVGNGRMLISSIDIEQTVLDPVRRQLRASLLGYAASERFQPEVELTPEQIQSLFAR